MSTGKTISFANFICKFGDEKDLLDLVTEIVIPAFYGKGLKTRSYDGTQYFFYEVELLNLASKKDTPVLAIAGRFVKDTVLTREQIYKPGRGLVKSPDKMDSSPSSIFVLILNNHKLVYFPETRSAPSISTFKSTAQFYINQQHKQFINQRYEELKEQNAEYRDELLVSTPRVTKKALLEQYPHATLEVVPIPSELSLFEFIKKYQKLNSISIKILRTNSEINNSKLIQSIRNNGRKLGANAGNIAYSGSKVGLDKTEAAKQLSEMTLDGNSEVKLSGIDINGNSLVGNNDEFKLKVAIDDVSPDINKAARQLYAAMRDEMENANLKFADHEDNATNIEKLREIASTLND